ncbi:MAG: hypothetical protein GYA24_01015 [Candidatus Lokiarchaeota archaeon]|nr:hypothetical protein [Candidatus Lokiarchaeota archaeon]
MRRTKGAIVAGILLLAVVPVFLTSHAIIVQGRMRIADPMIGAPQFSKPGGVIPVLVDMQGVVDPGSWEAWLQSIDFSWAPAIPLHVDMPGLPCEGKHSLMARVPAITLPGVYNLKVSCTSAGARISVVEPHAVCIYENLSTFRFAHLADPHVTYPDRSESMNLASPHAPETMGDRSINDNLRMLLENISIARPDLAIITGDIATRGLEQEFAAARNIIMVSRVPVLCTLGNHDHRSPPSFNQYLAPSYYARVIDAWRVVCLDSGATEGNGLFGEQLQWFGEQLAQAYAVGQQVMVAMHIPSTTEPVEGYTIAGNAEFRALCHQYNVRGIFTGHHHYSDAYYDNGSQVTLPDPIPPSAGPVYIKTGSTTLGYGNGDRGVGWRYVRSWQNGSMTIGYDMAGTGTSDPLEDLPLNGLLRVDGDLHVNLTNHYRVSFTSITVPVQLPLLSTTDTFVPSEGTIIGQVRDASMAGILLRITLPASSTKHITFART